MLRIVVIQPGSTDFDEQGRIKGSLDLPLSLNGAGQVARVAEQLAQEPIEAIYASPSQSAMQTAQSIAENHKLRVRRVQKLKNLDHGLWHGKLIDDVKLNQPRIYRQGLENPEAFCPPEGESVAAVRQRAPGRSRQVDQEAQTRHRGTRRPGATGQCGAWDLTRW